MCRLGVEKGIRDSQWNQSNDDGRREGEREGEREREREHHRMSIWTDAWFIDWWKDCWPENNKTKQKNSCFQYKNLIHINNVIERYIYTWNMKWTWPRDVRQERETKKMGNESK